MFLISLRIIWNSLMKSLQNMRLFNHNKELLFYERQKEIIREIENLDLQRHKHLITAESAIIRCLSITASLTLLFHW